MRSLNLIVLALMLLTACHNNSKSSSAMSEIMDTTNLKTNAQSVVDTPSVEGELKVNTWFDDGTGTSLVYIIDDKYCFYGYKVCEYYYDKSNKIIAINYDGILSDKPNDNIYFEVKSGYEVKNKGWDMGINVTKVEQNYDLTDNINNTSFALVQMVKLTTGQYQVLKDGGDRIGIYKPINTAKILNYYNNVLDGLKQSSESFDQPFLVTENKVDVLKNRGGDKVDAILANRVDYTYNSLMATWETLNNRKNKIENFLSDHQQVNTSQPYKPEMFTELISNLIGIKQLRVDNDKYNQTLDNEVLPLIQQP